MTPHPKKENLCQGSRSRGLCCVGRGRTFAAEDPHEDELDNVRINKKKLGASVPLRAGNGMHSASPHGCVASRVGEKDVFQRA